MRSGAAHGRLGVGYPNDRRNIPEWRCPQGQLNSNRPAAQSTTDPVWWTDTRPVVGHVMVISLRNELAIRSGSATAFSLITVPEPGPAASRA